MALELSDSYKKILEYGQFQSLLSPNPWPHFILDGLIEEKSFRSMQRRIIRAKRDFEIKLDHPAKLRLAYVDDLELAEFFFSDQMRRLFQGVAGCDLRPNEELAIQYRQMVSDSPEFPPHVDLIEEPSLVALYYLSPGWRAEKGGEVILQRREVDSPCESSSKWIAPIANRLLVFMSGDQHWHRVRKVNDWTRLLVLTEWLKEKAND